jgi:hypothetical protein
MYLNFITIHRISKYLKFYLLHAVSLNAPIGLVIFTTILYILTNVGGENQKESEEEDE